MNKSQLIDSVSKKSGLSKKDTEKGLISFIETIKDVLKQGEKLSIVGFGTFTVTHRKETIGINPRTKEKIAIPAKKVAKLKFSDSINSILNT